MAIAELPDGTQFEVPDGANADDVQRLGQQVVAAQHAAQTSVQADPNPNLLSRLFHNVVSAFQPPPDPQQSAGVSVWQSLMQGQGTQNVPGVPGGVPPGVPPARTPGLNAPSTDPIDRALQMPMDGRAYPGNSAAIGLLGALAGGRAVQEHIDLLPRFSRASANFDEVMQAAGPTPVDVTAPGNIALRTQDLARSGGSMPKVIRDFLKRVTDPNQPALSYSEARDFYSNATRLSADEFNRLTAVMKKQVGQFTSALNQSIADAAQQAGKLDQYQSAMSEYARAQRLRQFGNNAKDLLLNNWLKAAATGAGLGAGYEAYRKLGGN